jgi:serine/threonine-protein kinase
MKYVDGETLESIIEKLAAGDRDAHARFGVERRVQIFRGLLEAVAFAHDKGIVHRDIKPANVMVGRFGEVVLMDWGIAKRMRDPQAPLADVAHEQPVAPLTASKRGSLFETRAGEVVGTPVYMSPEQAQGTPIDIRSDVYSLCMLLHELLCLRHPLADKSTLDEVVHAVVHEPVPMTSFVASPHQPGAPAELSWFIRRGLEKDPAKRYQSVGEMIERLDRRDEGLIPVQCQITFLKRTSREWIRFLDRHPMIATVILGISVLAVGAAGVLLVMRALSG